MFLALRELKHQKLRYGLVSLIILLIIFLVLFITGLANGLANDNGAAIAKNPAQTYVLAKDSENRFNRSQLTNTQVQQIRTKLGSGTALAILQTTVQKTTQATQKTDITFFALQNKTDFKVKATNGQTLTQLTDNQVLVSDQLQEAGYKVGGTLVDSISGQRFKIKGFVQNQTYAHTPVIFINHQQLQSIRPQQAYNAVASTKVQNKRLTGFDQVSRQTIVENIPGYAAETGSLKMMLGFLYVISVVVLAVFFYVITIQKLQEFGTLKALGTSTGYLGRYLLYEVGLVTLLAIILSSLLTLLLAHFLPAGLPFIITWPTVLGTGVLFLVIALLSGLVSLFKITKVDPVTAIGGQG